MAGKPVQLEQEWSVHAQLTFSHGSPPPLSPTPSPHPCYGFQRGNIVFTTKPPGDKPVYGSLPSRRVPQPYGRRCMSTCNITLAQQDHHHQRCHHTVTLSCDEPSTYNRTADVCDICSGGGRSPTAARRAHTFTSHFCTRVPDKSSGSKDVASQTSQVFSHEPSSDRSLESNTNPKDMLQVPHPDSDQSITRCKSPKNGRRLSRSPARVEGKSPLLNKTNTDSKKKPRTVHIDVYCTGSDASGSSDAEDSSTPQTVYESEKMRVTHTREVDKLPQSLCRQKRRTLSAGSSTSSGFISKAGASNNLQTNDSESSLYPSQMSSFSSISNPRSSIVSDSSLASHLSSSCALFSNESGTSWKDTSTADTIGAILGESSSSLGKSDSFEYADSLDRLRILEKERAWGAGSKTWRSPQVERKHLLQQQKHQQYVERRGSPFPQWKSDENEDKENSSSDESESSQGSEMAWSFGRLEDIQNMKSKFVKREDTVRKAIRDVKLNPQGNKNKVIRCDSGSLSDSATPSMFHKYSCRDAIGPFGVDKESSPKTKLTSSVTSPFTSVPGKKTDQLSKAEKFGTIVGAFKKPGHHIGPSKNPDCSCQNCRQFYEEKGYRSRTRSLGDMPSPNQRDQWKATLNNIVQNRLTEDSGSGEWDV